MSDFGTMATEGATRTLRFERVLHHPPTEVWSALTDSERLGDWLAAAEVEPGPGGTITLDFGEGGIENCRITVWDPPRSLAYEWNFLGEKASHVSWELVVVDDGAATRLTLEHTLLDADVAPDYGAGWHAHLDQLAGHLSGKTPEWDGLFEALRPRYAEIASSESSTA
jgi:uncharacterized protein YndB with AHSA1/START domain